MHTPPAIASEVATAGSLRPLAAKGTEFLIEVELGHAPPVDVLYTATRCVDFVVVVVVAVAVLPLLATFGVSKQHRPLVDLEKHRGARGRLRQLARCT